MVPKRRAKKLKLSERVQYEMTPGGNRRALNPKRRLKRQLMEEHGITTGRQLKKLRRRLRQEGRASNA